MTDALAHAEGQGRRRQRDGRAGWLLTDPAAQRLAERGGRFVDLLVQVMDGGVERQIPRCHLGRAHLGGLDAIDEVEDRYVGALEDAGGCCAKAAREKPSADSPISPSVLRRPFIESPCQRALSRIAER